MFDLIEWILKIRKNIWLVPSVYCLVSSLLAIFIIWIDTAHGEKVQDIFPASLLISVNLAQTILATIAAALLTMITITFSTIMVVLTTYSSQFSPRTLTDFITNKITMRVLGIYMGGFMYSILTLLFMREDLTYEVLGATIAVFFSIICLSFFAYFIHFVAASIQVNKLISEVTRQTLKTVKERMKTKKGEEKVRITNDKPNLAKNYYSKKEFKSETFGYIQLIEYQHLFDLAKKYDLVVELNQRIGAFITDNKTVFTVYYKKDLPKIKLKKFVVLGVERTILQDVEFGIRKIVEVTLRAISPGINDPNTAIDGILHLGKLLGRASEQDGRYLLYEIEKEVKVIAPQKTFEELLYTTFSQICHYGQNDLSILIAIYDACMMIAEESGQTIRQQVWQFSRYIKENFNLETLHEKDLNYFHLKERQLRDLTANVL
ncbi:hypothetical protein BkAM31D_12665 [Halalkalibacter krulwichiae]|uniref:DUF2254 domain-containing protein n=1 Tax=Halalkalibacter krulwichiae TaxID=199441 RepID=A0A1X9MEQ9_9BACI|nr:hypothetical protein BkAM31D_12665 [Halalkalibacter krulwichiae]